MSYGLTPYDKKSYKASKRRRRQAKRAESTGKILPFSVERRRIIAAVCIAVALIGATVGVYFACNAIFFTVPEKNKTVQRIEQEKSSELMRVVNRRNPLTSDFIPSLTEYGSFRVNTLAAENLKALISKAEKNGVQIKLTSAYISFDEQNTLYKETLSKLLQNPDYTNVRAQAAAQKLVPPAGCSEAQTGLLVGFDMSNEKTAAFIGRNCVDFGFVQRYSKDKEDITRMSENKTLYRYVGADGAVKMRSYNMCLEEYAEYISLQKNKDKI